MMEKWLGQILLIIVVVPGYVPSSTIQVQTLSNETLAFAPNLPGQEYVRTGEFIELNCSASGYSFLNWKKWDEKDGFMEFPWYPGNARLRLRNNNQILQITRALEDIDDGLYLCQAGDTLGKVVQHKVVLTVISCHVTDGKIYNTKTPPSKVIKSVGETVHLDCEGYFGCAQKGSEDERIAQWEYVEGGSHPKTVRNSSRYTIHSKTSVDSVVVGSYLQIKPIEEEDYKTTFVCLLQTVQVDSALTFEVTIEPPEVKHLYNLIYILVMVPIIPLLVISYCLWGERIKYFFKFRCLKFKADEATVASEVIVLHSVHDETFVNDHIKPHVEEQGYQVFTRKSIPAGHFEVGEFADKVPSSSIIFIVYSSYLLDDTEAVYIFKTIKEAAHKGVVVIQKEKIPKEKLDEFKDDKILKKAPSFMKTVRFPFNDSSNQRKLTNFYYGLKLNLPPKPPIADDTESISRGDSVSSTAPLMARRADDDNRICYNLRDESTQIIQSGDTSSSKTCPQSQISNDSGRGESPNQDEMPFFGNSDDNV